MVNHIYYEADGQLIIGVVLPDGRRFSIDMRVPKPELKQVQDTNEILVSATIAGLAAN